MEAPLGHVPDIQAVNGNAAAGHVVKPWDQLTQGGLAAAGGADDGHGLPRVYLKAHIVEHRQIAIIGEGHVLHVDLSPGICQLPCVRLVLNRRLRAHDLHEPIQSREAVGEQLGEIAQLAHGVYKGGNIQVEGDQVPIVHFAAHNVVAAEADDQHIEHTQEELHAALEHAHGLVKAPLGGFEGLVGGLEPLAFRRLVGEGLGRPETGQAAFDLLVDVAGFLLGNGRGPGHPAPHGHGHRQKNRDGQGHHQGQLPADGGHHRQSTQNGQHAGEQILRAVVGKLRQLEQVGGEPGHELAGTVPVVVVTAKLLHVGKQVFPDIRLHPNAEGMAVVGHDVIEERAQHIAGRHQSHDPEEHAVGLVGQIVIQGLPGDQGKGHVNERHAHGTAQVDGEEPPVISEIMKKDRQRRFALIVLCGHFLSPS